jgi:hypothetical protein
MKSAVLSAVLLGTWCASGDPDPEKVAKDVLQSMQDVTAVLKTVKDKDSADAAARKLEEPAKRLLVAVEAGNKIPRDDPDVAKVLEKFAEQMAKAGRDFQLEVDRLLKEPELQKILRKSPAWRQSDLQFQESKLARAKLDVKTLEVAIQAWHVKFAEWPASLEKLTEPSKDTPAFLLKSALTDPWGRPYRYDPKQRHPKTDVPLIWSDGPIPRDAGGRIANWSPQDKAGKQ